MVQQYPQYPLQQYQYSTPPVPVPSYSAPPNQGIPPLPYQQPYQQQVTAQQLEQLAQVMQSYQANIQALWGEIQRLSQAQPGQLNVPFPEQFRAGKIKYPYLFPRPFTWIEEIQETENQPYATTAGATSQAQFSFDNIFSFVTHIEFALVRTSSPEAPALPVGMWLPLCADYMPFITPGDIYIGKDFQFRLFGKADNQWWQSGTDWRTSREANRPKGFKFEVEYQTVPQDFITVQVQALAPPLVDDAYHLFGMLHGYKMSTPTEGYVPVPGIVQK